MSYLADWKVSMKNITKTGNLTDSELAFRFSFNESPLTLSKEDL